MSSPESKIFRFTIRKSRIITPAIPAHKRGVSRSSRYVGWNAVDALASGVFFTPDENAKAYGEVVWSWRRDAGAKLLRSKLLRGDGGKKARSPGRARSKP